ncbi:DNA cytosine methyltransferase [Micromonospora marina]|uniref:DNA cytosine methyltransferase n=1 Tax=Micromonospora marina TaxID=307120 RepID=UPI0034561BD1
MTAAPRKKRKFRTVSLFSGAGGLDVGVDQAGLFDLLACVELQPRFCETLTLNRDNGLFGTENTRIIQADLSKLDPYELMDELGLKPGELDLLAGGPPCQSFSTAGRRRTVEDPRGTLLWDFLRFVEAFKPKYFLMENVRGLLSAALRHRPIADRPDKGGPPLTAEERQGSVIELWADDMAKVDNGIYRVDCFEVNAVNYGAPQLRERVLFIGNRVNQQVEFPEPTHGPIDPATGQPQPGLLPHCTLRDALAAFRDDDPVLMDFSPRKKHYLAMIPAGGNWRTLPTEVAQESMGKAFFAKGGRSGWWRRLSWDLPCPTIVTLPNHASTSMCHPDEVRALSVGEFARVQEFPDGWSFAGSAMEQMAQVGNAVPVRLGLVAAHTIARYLERPSDLQATEGDLPRFRRVYLNSHVRTRQWYKAGQAFVWDGIGGSAHYGRRTPTQQEPLPLFDA